MNQKGQAETLQIEVKQNFTPSVITKIRIPATLYSRLLNAKKKKGLKESHLILISVDEFLSKNNF